MTSESLPFRGYRWGHLFALMLAGTMLLQSGPIRLLRLLVQQGDPGSTEHACQRCANGLCPRDPEAPCTCRHSDSDESDTGRIVLKTCDGEGAEALAPIVPKWQSLEFPDAPSLRVTGTRRTHLYPSLSPQWFGDEVFRLPRTTSLVRLT